jgi:hypothetical protein
MGVRKLRRIAGLILVCLGWALLLGACSENQYGPPPAGGAPENWGQQHYLDNQRRAQEINDGSTR